MANGQSVKRNKIRAATAAVIPMTAALLAGCVSGGGPAGHVLSQPNRAVYDCGADGRLTVQRLGAEVDVVSPRGVQVRLPASPPGQSARFGEPPYALLFDEREILWFVTGKKPIACAR